MSHRLLQDFWLPKRITQYRFEPVEVLHSFSEHWQPTGQPEATCEAFRLVVAVTIRRLNSRFLGSDGTPAANNGKTGLRYHEGQPAARVTLSWR